MGKNFLELKDNKFEYVICKGDVNKFGDLKRFCGDDITITYETSSVDDFWDIELYDSLKEKDVVVPDGYYIVKLKNGFTAINPVDVRENFNFKIGITDEK